jgi:dethiobiotin synthase
MKLGIFVTGTDTGIGKTLVSGLLLAALRSYGIKSGYFKPVQTGSDLDTHTVSHWSGIHLDRLPNPTYLFPEPIAPYTAAKMHGQEIQLDQIQQEWHQLDERAWVVEGAGGLLVPLNGRQTNRDLIQALELRTLIVASTRLGTINHTLLTLEAAEKVGLPLCGIVLNGPEEVGVESILSEYSSVPIIAKVPQLPNLSPAVIQEVAAQYFPVTTLRQLYE